MVLVQNWKFFHIFNIGYIAQQNVFESVLERKKAFSDYKKNKPEKVENLEFFYIGKIAQQNVLESIVKRKQVFPDYKKNKLKKWIKIGIFPKGLFSLWFW